VDLRNLGKTKNFSPFYSGAHDPFDVSSGLSLAKVIRFFSKNGNGLLICHYS